MIDLIVVLITGLIIIILLWSAFEPKDRWAAMIIGFTWPVFIIYAIYKILAR